ncbi:sugar ABC transporter permease [Sulfitobacter geojensis]|jgi:D-xylose transport system permease protein|uniref:Xylose transport system permease protein XylH n=1 Tax=Sulfitobacter geojensis TaxID=1342299 RepID=A0AAE2W1M1_9RHOB|nr:sugar ABC transporter permease [Sulfitobacter geojensis]MBM1691332.1 sugar ABC transporter permease [Sulfitobacter geojensis]MBM1695345.1 sugar ABC transporter permease [Sulfitobacter geojensis]MBM1707445.1 sugar ABC transporter permease [Sulfitobacter geojensis]MBM1711648.1 sugar ABC transporter permease [Sulfitobacter geojensis]MBM1715623.1 sugar ABC transporter permease [Sulfitobacter geojensis]
MTDQTTNKPAPRRSLLNTLEVDTRLLGMIGAFVLVALVFNILTEGRFLTPRNIFNLTIQTASVAIMATGMVFVIVTRHIDLSVGAVLAACSALMAMTQVRFLPGMGFEIGHWAIPWIAIGVGIILGAIIGAFNGWLIGYQGIPAFIVTLGGFLVWRNVGWYQTSGQTIGPLDKTFMTFGGINGTLGGPLSWALGILAILASVVLIFRARRTKIAHDFPVKPMWAEVSLAAICTAAIAGFIAILTNYSVPERVVARDPAKFGCEVAEGCTPVYGLPISVLLLVGIAIIMTIIARRTRFGRYIFATGGNPDAAELSGINTKFLTVKIFALMGILCAISAVVASSRLANHSNDLGTLDELRVIAAAVIGGTALSGGIGTIYGAILGALIMQSLQSGMAMVGVDAPLQNIVVGAVLVFAVFIDIQYRKRTGAK